MKKLTKNISDLFTAEACSTLNRVDTAILKDDLALMLKNVFLYGLGGKQESVSFETKEDVLFVVDAFDKLHATLTNGGDGIALKNAFSEISHYAARYMEVVTEMLLTSVLYAIEIIGAPTNYSRHKRLHATSVAIKEIIIGFKRNDEREQTV